MAGNVGKRGGHKGNISSNRTRRKDSARGAWGRRNQKILDDQRERRSLRRRFARWIRSFFSVDKAVRS